MSAPIPRSFYLNDLMNLVTSITHSPTVQQWSSTPRCSSPAKSAIEPSLPSAPCSVLSSPRPPPPPQDRSWHSGRWCSSLRSGPSGPAEWSEDNESSNRTITHARDALTPSSRTHHKNVAEETRPCAKPLGSVLSNWLKVHTHSCQEIFRLTNVHPETCRQTDGQTDRKKETDRNTDTEK